MNLIKPTNSSEEIVKELPIIESIIKEAIILKTSYNKPRDKPNFYDFIKKAKVINILELAKLKKTFDNLFNNTVKEIKEGSKVYFMPGVDFPRYKFNDFFKDSTSKRVINFNNSTCIVINKDCFYKELITFFNYSGILMKNPSLLNISRDTVNEDLDQYTLDNSLVLQQSGWSGSTVLNNIEDANSNGDIFQNINNIETYGVINSNADFNFIELLFNIQNDNHYQFIEIEDLTKIIIKDGIEIDRERYYNLREMIVSPDKANVDLALELLSNSNYEKNRVRICFLFCEFSQIIRYSIFSRSVNFKPLFNFVTKELKGSNYIYRPIRDYVIDLVEFNNIQDFETFDQELIINFIQTTLDTFNPFSNTKINFNFEYNKEVKEEEPVLTIQK